MRTDPDTIKQLSSDYRLLHHHAHLRTRSPSSILKEGPKPRRPQVGKVPIRKKQEVSICD